MQLGAMTIITRTRVAITRGRVAVVRRRGAIVRRRVAVVKRRVATTRSCSWNKSRSNWRVVVVVVVSWEKIVSKRTCYGNRKKLQDYNFLSLQFINLFIIVSPSSSPSSVHINIVFTIVLLAIISDKVIQN